MESFVRKFRVFLNYLCAVPINVKTVEIRKAAYNSATEKTWMHSNSVQSFQLLSGGTEGNYEKI
jgi:ABC-type uncharacterized transport system YnjBCD ATPase subunit